MVKPADSMALISSAVNGVAGSNIFKGYWLKCAVLLARELLGRTFNLFRQTQELRESRVALQMSFVVWRELVEELDQTREW